MKLCWMASKDVFYTIYNHNNYWWCSWKIRQNTKIKSSTWHFYSIIYLLTEEPGKVKFSSEYRKQYIKKLQFIFSTQLTLGNTIVLKKAPKVDKGKKRSESIIFLWFRYINTPIDRSFTCIIHYFTNISRELCFHNFETQIFLQCSNAVNE